MKLNKQNFIQMKIYFDRARIYIGYIQFLMIGIVLCQSIKDTKLGMMIYNFSVLFFPAILIVFTFIILFIGYLDTRFGFREEELKNLSNSNPIIMEILSTLRELKNENKNLEKNEK